MAGALLSWSGVRGASSCPSSRRRCRGRQARPACSSAQLQEGQQQQQQPVVRLRPEQVLSQETFRPFGQVFQAQDDGKPFDAADAQLDLSQGTPRLYVMRLPETGLGFGQITYHERVTQCLGALGERPWHMAVAAPTHSVDAWPREADLRVFRVPPGVFLKLEAGTWHAGPLFAGVDHMDFVNLELSDTNVADHNTHKYSGGGPAFEVEPL